MPAPSDLVSWWAAEGNAVDAGNAGNNGAMVNGAAFAVGKVGQGFSFAASSSYVEVPDSMSLHLTNELTIEFWAKRLSLGLHYIVEKGGDWTAGQTDFGVDLNDVYPAGPHFAFTFAGGWRGTPVTADLQWHHYAVVAQQGQANPALYIDGAAQPVTLSQGGASILLNGSAQPLHIGAQLDPKYTYFSQTLIDELSIYRRALTTGEIQAIYNTGSAGKCPFTRGTNCVPQVSGLVSWWPGDGTGSDVADSNDGVLYDTTFAPGRVGPAFSFAGTNSYLEVPDSASLRLTNELTIEFWAARLSSGLDYIIEKGGDWTSGQTDYGVDLNDVYGGGPHFTFTFAGGWRGTPVAMDLLWHHYAVTARQGEADPLLYIDGVAQPVTLREGASLISLKPSDKPLHIGAQIDPNYTYFSQTLIDELAIYGRELSAAEIESIYNAGSSGKCFPALSLAIVVERPNVRVSWPIWANNFVLQQTTGDLSNSTAWNSSSVQTVTNNNRLVVVEPISNGTRFYRLIKQ